MDQVLGQVEERFREGISTLSGWSDELRNTLNRPDVVVSSLVVAGFLGGMMLRRGRSQQTVLPVNPLLVVGASLLAGLVLGP